MLNEIYRKIKDPYEKIKPYYIAVTLFMIYAKQFIISVEWFDGPVASAISMLLTASYLLLMFNFAYVWLGMDLKYKGFTALICILLSGSLIVTRDASLFAVILVMFLLYEYDYNKGIKTIAFSKILMYCITMLLCITGKIETVYMDWGRIRHAMGFAHPNTLGSFTIIIFFMLWYFYLQNKKILSISISAIIFLFLWFYVDSRTSAMLCILFAGMLIIQPLFEKLDFLCVRVPVASFILSLILTINSDFLTTFINDCNFRARYFMPHMAMKEWGIHLFGHILPPYEVSAILLDNAYMQLLVKYGIIATVIVLAAWTAMIVKLIRYKQHALLMLFTILLIYGQMEFLVISFGYNFVIIGLLAKFDSPEKASTQKSTTDDNTQISPETVI